LNFITIPLTKLYRNKIKPLFVQSDGDSRAFLFKKVDDILMMRKSKEINKRDFMQLLLEAEVTDISSFNDHNKLTTDASKFSVEKKLTYDVKKT
jgi:transcriptional/translational regulatory protein YebC/TACO1